VPDAETEPPARACPVCGAPTDGHRISHLKFERGRPGGRFSLHYAEPCGCRLEAPQYGALVRALALVPH